MLISAAELQAHYFIKFFNTLKKLTFILGVKEQVPLSYIQSIIHTESRKQSTANYLYFYLIHSSGLTEISTEHAAMPNIMY